MKISQILTLFMIALLLCGNVAAENSDVDYLELAALMMRDGNLDRALLALDQVDMEDEDLDLVRYYTLRGMAHLRRNENELARDAFLTATQSGEVDSVVYVYLAQIHFQLEDYQATIDSLERAGQAVEHVPSVYHMRAQCYWLLQQPDLALATLDQASQVFAGDTSFLRRKIFFLVDLGLFKTAVELGRAYLEQSSASLEDHLALGNALRASGSLDEAAVLLEAAQLQFPYNPTLKKVLAHVYMDRGQLSVAADILYQAALLDPVLLAESAELYRRSGQLYRALTLNSQLVDQTEKLRQRLAIYLELQNFEQVVAMETSLYRVGLMQDEDLRYAIAYALFKSGEFVRAESHLSKLTRPDLFRKAAELRRAIQDCNEDAWQCI